MESVNMAQMPYGYSQSYQNISAENAEDEGASIFAPAAVGAGLGVAGTLLLTKGKGAKYVNDITGKMKELVSKLKDNVASKFGGKNQNAAAPDNEQKLLTGEVAPKNEQYNPNYSGNNADVISEPISMGSKSKDTYENSVLVIGRNGQRALPEAAVTDESRLLAEGAGTDVPLLPEGVQTPWWETSGATYINGEKVFTATA